MSLTTYAGLLAAVGDWLERSDTSTLVPDWIALAEAEMNKGLRVNAMITRATATISDGFSVVPTDFLAPRSAKLYATPFTLLKFLTQEQMADFKADLPTGDLVYYTLVGTEFEYGPTPSASSVVSLTYYQKIPALTSLATSNWVLASHPGAYLHGCLKHAGVYYRDNDLAQTHAQLFDAQLDAIRQTSRGDLAFNLTPIPSSYAI